MIDFLFIQIPKKNVYGTTSPEKLFLEVGFLNQINDPVRLAHISSMIKNQAYFSYGHGSDVIKYTSKYSRFFDNYGF